MDKTYQPDAVEARIYEQWEENGSFGCGHTRSGESNGESYSIVIPPPNVTGSLHMGHALNNTLQDILARFERLRGKDVLWQPGTDHAGIATQALVEKRLFELEGKTPVPVAHMPLSVLPELANGNAVTTAVSPVGDNHRVAWLGVTSGEGTHHLVTIDVSTITPTLGAEHLIGEAPIALS